MAWLLVFHFGDVSRSGSINRRASLRGIRQCLQGASCKRPASQVHSDDGATGRRDSKKKPTVLILEEDRQLGNFRPLIADLRQKFPMLGIVVIAENTGSVAHEMVLHDGADYFLHKPIKDSVVLATVCSFLRRLHILHAPTANTIEAWALYRRNGTLISPSNERIALSDKECAVLTTLFLSPYFPVSAEHLLRALNITAELFDPHRIDTIIYRIRKKLNRLTHARFEIRNIYGRGFLCVGTKEGTVFYVWDG